MQYLVALLITIISFVSTSSFAHTQKINSKEAQEKLKNLEISFGGKMGIYAINTNNNQIISYQANKRFPVQSTMKLISVAALLKQSNSNEKLLQEKVYYTKDDLIPWHPITGKYINSGATFETLSEAAITYSDNTAANLIIKKLGGPQAITAFARSIGNMSFNIKHYEGNLNSNPNEIDDTATPNDMAISVQKLILGNVLTKPQRTQLVTWMRNNTTGYKRIRSGAPIGWIVAEKTGSDSGSYSIANDIGIMWSPLCKPIVLAIYAIKQNTKTQDDIVASATSIIIEEFAKNSPCFKALYQ